MVVAIIVLVVAAIGAGVFFLTRDGDEDEGETSGSPVGGENQVTTLPDTPGATEAPGGGDTTPGLPAGDTLEAAAEWTYTNTPGSVDQEESTCIAQVVIDVVGEERVAQAEGNLLSVYSTTSLDEDSQISTGVAACVDSESAAELEEDLAWPW